MILTRHGHDEASLIEQGSEMMRLSVGAAGPDAFHAALDALEAALCRPAPPRLAVVYREGLFAEAVGEAAAEVLLIEEDPQDDPPRRLLRQVTEPRPEALQALLARLGLSAAPAPGAAR
jgi:hypothetical protein